MLLTLTKMQEMHGNMALSYMMGASYRHPGEYTLCVRSVAFIGFKIFLSNKSQVYFLGIFPITGYYVIRNQILAIWIKHISTCLCHTVV